MQEHIHTSNTLESFLMQVREWEWGMRIKGNKSIKRREKNPTVNGVHVSSPFSVAAEIEVIWGIF